MKTLSTVHHGLRRLRGFRAMVRLGSAWSAWICVVLWALAGAFLLDYWMRMGRLERGILLLAVLGVIVWTVVRHLAPALRVRENDVALALLVERHQGLNSDLVAALQFADAGRDQYGSGALREAVVDCTAEASGSLDFLEGFSREQLGRRAAMLVATVLLVIAPAAVFPRYTRAFLDRFFLLGGAHYPTRTIIERIVSPGGDATPYGRPVVFQVRAGGQIPPAGHVRVQAVGSDLATVVTLAPDPNDPALFAGKLQRVLDDLSYTVHLGDAYTESRLLRVIPLPLVSVRLDVTPPAYAAEAFAAERDPAKSSLAPEGSRVGLEVSADKPLVSGSVAVDQAGYTLSARDGALALDPGGTVFEKVAEPMRFKVQVVDADGLSLERPISGVVQVLPDRAPRIAAAAVSRYVLPTAKAMIMLKALDDYGLSKIVLHQIVTRTDANQVESSVTIATPPKNPTQFAMWHQLKLAPLKLLKGDRLSVTIEAIDYRGDDPGRGTQSDPITFLVTDRQGLLAAMQKLDDRMIERLDEIIRAQLGIGD